MMILTRHGILAAGGNDLSWLREFCRQVESDTPPDREVQENVARLLKDAITKADEIDPEGLDTKRSEKVARAVYRSLGFNRPPHRKARTSTEAQKPMDAAKYFIEQEPVLGRTDALEGTAEKYGKSERQIERYVAQYGGTVRTLEAIGQKAKRFKKKRDAIYRLANKLTRGAATPMSDSFPLEAEGMPLFVRPLSIEQLSELKKIDRTYGGKHWALDDWFFNNTLYETPDGAKPVSFGLSIADLPVTVVYNFYYQLLSLYKNRPIK